MEVRKRELKWGLAEDTWLPAQGQHFPSGKPLWASSTQLCLPCCCLHRVSIYRGQKEKVNGRDSAKNCKVAKAREVPCLTRTPCLSEANCSLAVFTGANWKGVKGSRPALDLFEQVFDASWNLFFIIDCWALWPAWLSHPSPLLWWPAFPFSCSALFVFN